MAWIESHTILLRHRKLKELARSLRLKPVYVLGHLHALWHDALDQQEDGDLTKWSDEMIADSSGYDGDAPQYVSLLQLHGWLDGRLIHDWLDYAGLYLIKKYSSKKRDKLIEIWAKHGRFYGSPNPQAGEWKESEWRTEEEPKPNIPNLTKPNLNKPNVYGDGSDRSKEPKKQFVPPTPEEVMAYAKTINFSLDGEKFCAYYDTRGWIVGKSKMKDWRAAVVTWKKNSPSFSAGASSKFDVERAADEREKKKIELLKSGRCVNVVNGRFCGGKPDESGFCSGCQTIKVTDIFNLKSANLQGS